MSEPLTSLDTSLLEKIAGMKGTPKGAYNIRKDSGCASRESTETSKSLQGDKPGSTSASKTVEDGELSHPLLITNSALGDGYYDVYIGSDCVVTIVRGGGISNCGHEDSGTTASHLFLGKKIPSAVYREALRRGRRRGYADHEPQDRATWRREGFLKMDTPDRRGRLTRAETMIVCGKGAEALRHGGLLTGTSLPNSDMRCPGRQGPRGRVVSARWQRAIPSMTFRRALGNDKCFGHVRATPHHGRAKFRSVPRSPQLHGGQLHSRGRHRQDRGDQLLSSSPWGSRRRSGG
jgi:hypothetical protein